MWGQLLRSNTGKPFITYLENELEKARDSFEVASTMEEVYKLQVKIEFLRRLLQSKDMHKDNVQKTILDIE